MFRWSKFLSANSWDISMPRTEAQIVNAESRFCPAIYLIARRRILVFFKMLISRKKQKQIVFLFSRFSDKTISLIDIICRKIHWKALEREQVKILLCEVNCLLKWSMLRGEKSFRELIGGNIIEWELILTSLIHFHDDIHCIIRVCIYIN